MFEYLTAEQIDRVGNLAFEIVKYLLTLEFCVLHSFIEMGEYIHPECLTLDDSDIDCNYTSLQLPCDSPIFIP